MEQLIPVIFLLLGIFIGYAMSRKQQDKPIVTMPQILKSKETVEPDVMDELIRCQYGPEEWEQITKGRRKA